MWQPAYAEVGIPTFPVDGKKKKPAVKNYLRAGVPASREWASKYPDATAIGFACGRLSNLTLIDIDAPDENLLADALSLFGESAIVTRTASGKFHIWYRHNGEKRQIRIDGLGGPVDLLGEGGYAIAPPSSGARGYYEFISGSLDDIASLRPAKSLAPQPTLGELLRQSSGSVIEGERNNFLFRACLQAAPRCSSLNQLIAQARKISWNKMENPLPESEIRRVAESAWGYETTGTNWAGKGQKLVISHDECDRLMALGPDCFTLYSYLRRHHWGRDFVAANAMAEHMPDGHWALRRFVKARKKLIDAGELVELRPASGINGPALYGFPTGSDPESANSPTNKK